MKKVVLFAIILSLSSLLIVGCSKDDAGDNGVNAAAPKLNSDANKPASTDNPLGAKPSAPL